MLSARHKYKVDMYICRQLCVGLSSPVGGMNDVSNSIMTLQLILMLKLSFMDTFVITFHAVQHWYKFGSTCKLHCSAQMGRRAYDGI